MSQIESIRDLDDEVFEEFQVYFPKIKSSIFCKEFPCTNLIMQLYDTSGNFIKNSIYDGCETDDYYGIKILYRCLIEHFLRFKYVFVKFRLEKSDVFAKQYLEYNEAREILDSLKAKVSEQKLFDSNFKIVDWDKFLECHPSFKNKTRKEVEEETNKYTFKNIVQYLNNQFKSGGLETSAFMGKLIVDYSYLSSFVHGGINSYQEMMSLNTEETRQNEYNRICGLTFQMSSTIKLFSLLLYFQYDKEEFGSHYLRLDSIIKKLNR